MSDSQENVDRRVVLRAAAWTTPAILLSVSAPAAIASAGTITIDAWSWSRRENYGWIEFSLNSATGVVPVVSFGDPDMNDLPAQPLGGGRWRVEFVSESVFSEPPIAFPLFIDAVGYAQATVIITNTSDADT